MSHLSFLKPAMLQDANNAYNCHQGHHSNAYYPHDAHAYFKPHDAYFRAHRRVLNCMFWQMCLIII